MRIKSIVSLSMAFLATFALLPCQADAAYEGKKIRLKLASPSPNGSNMVRGYEKFVELVDEYSDGNIEVRLYSNAVLGSDRATLESVQLGSLDMASCSSPNMAAFAREYMVFDLPYVTSPEFQQNLYKALDEGELGKYYEAVANKIGLTTIMWSEYGYRNFVSADQPLTSLGAFRNLKVRTTDSPVEASVARAFGMIPSPVAWGEVYTALQQGTVDAEGNNWEHLVTAKHIEVLKYAVDSEHNYSMHILFMNKDLFDKLPELAKQDIRKAAKDALKWQREISVTSDSDAKKAMLDAGIKFHDLTEAQRAEIIERTNVVWEEYKDQLDQKGLKLLQDTQK